MVNLDSSTSSGVIPFQALVSPAEYNRLMDFPYLASEAEVTNFTQFVNTLQIDGSKPDTVKSTYCQSVLSCH